MTEKALELTPLCTRARDTHFFVYPGGALHIKYYGYNGTRRQQGLLRDRGGLAGLRHR